MLRKVVDEQLDLSDAARFLISPRRSHGRRRSPARLFRISFSGELAYEIAVPARYGDAAIRAVMAAGEEFGITPYGTEALGVMRIEKGHVAGNEFNGQTDRARPRPRPHDVEEEGLYRPRDGAAPGVARAGPAGAGRLQAGRSSAAVARRRAFPCGRRRRHLENDEGYMTSVAFSPMLGHWIGLGVLERGPQRIGERVRAYDPVRNGDVEVEFATRVHRSGRSAAPWLASPNAPRWPGSRRRDITAAPAPA